MRPASTILSPDKDRELRSAIVTLQIDPTDARANEILFDFVSTVLRIGKRRTPTARRVARQGIAPCDAR
jgi:hypothetical protein